MHASHLISEKHTDAYRVNMFKFQEETCSDESFVPNYGQPSKSSQSESRKKNSVPVCKLNLP